MSAIREAALEFPRGSIESPDGTPSRTPSRDFKSWKEATLLFIGENSKIKRGLVSIPKPSPPLSLGNSGTEEIPAPLQELGSRVQAVHRDEETLASLESYVDECSENIIMGKPQKSASVTTPTSKHTRLECSACTSTISPEQSHADVLDYIDKKLASLDAHLALVEVLHRELQALSLWSSARNN
ncbi:hypothetical protein CRENBAI_022674 [Crenichthys baileyi]|uniref:Uncharacterized protein n=1 Tax=Crenichthys baileyi TaxID=28760 RepID=A0AAV9R6E3_9TELE